MLAYFGGYTQQEIARLTDTPLGTVKTRTLAALRKLKTGLAGYDENGNGGGTDMSSHQDWEEIAAGHALGALEPDDEQRFEAHLRTCAECRAGARRHRGRHGRAGPRARARWPRRPSSRPG